MPEILACLTNAGAGGNTRFSCSTVSMFDDIAPPRIAAIECYSCTPAFKQYIQPTQDGHEISRHERGARPATPARFHLRQPLAAAPALPRPNRRPGDLRLAVLAGTVLPANGDVRRQQRAVAHPRLGLGARRGPAKQAQRDRADA